MAIVRMLRAFNWPINKEQLTREAIVVRQAAGLEVFMWETVMPNTKNMPRRYNEDLIPRRLEF